MIKIANMEHRQIEHKKYMPDSDHRKYLDDDLSARQNMEIQILQLDDGLL